MKKVIKVLPLFILPISLASLVSCKEKKTIVLHYDYIYYDNFCVGYFDSNSLGSGFENVEIDYNSLIAGDALVITYTGEMIATESYPGTLILDGRITDYYIYKTRVEEIKTSDISYENGYPAIYGGIRVETDYVILDKEKSCVKLSEYTGESLYWTYEVNDYEATGEGFSCVQAEPVPKVVVGLYAYNPR